MLNNLEQILILIIKIIKVKLHQIKDETQGTFRKAWSNDKAQGVAVKSFVLNS